MQSLAWLTSGLARGKGRQAAGRKRRQGRGDLRVPHAWRLRLEWLEPRHLLTDVSGHITQPTLWDNVAEPYVLVGDLYVDSGVTLTVGAGVRYEDHGSAFGLTVLGTLAATGATLAGDYNNVVVRSGGRANLADCTIPGNYSSITFNSGSAGLIDRVRGDFWTMSVASNSVSVVETLELGEISVLGGCTLSIRGGTTVRVGGDLTVAGNSTILAQAKNTSAQVDGVWAGVGVTINAGNLTIKSGSKITPDGQGYVGVTGSSYRVGCGPDRLRRAMGWRGRAIRASGWLTLRRVLLTWKRPIDPDSLSHCRIRRRAVRARWCSVRLSGAKTTIADDLRRHRPKPVAGGGGARLLPCSTHYPLQDH